MVLRKPYAILIQYFQRIHLILVFLCAYIFYKIVSLRSFITNFLDTESYNAYYESINKYTNFTLFISIILVVVISIILLVLLNYKKKPWKIYLLPIFEYIFMLIILIFIKSYFDNYNSLSTITSIMALRDLLNIIYLPQYIVFIIFGIRFLGIDLKKFGFKNDEEYLDIKEEDREEFEVNIEFDKDKISRGVKKFFRHVKYVYYEHLLVCNTLIIILSCSLIGYTYYYFGILHKTYKEGNSFSANYYDIKVNSSYLTDKDSKGNIIGNDQYFLVVNLTVKNNASKRNINLDRFRVMNKNEQFYYITRYYEYFKDLGKAYDNKVLETGDEVTFILVYKVSKKLDNNKYVLYYTDVTNNILLKKVKLKALDVTNLVEYKTSKVLEKMTFPNNNTFKVTNFKVVDETSYSRYYCDDYGCNTRELELKPSTKILEISFISNNFTGESFVDFSNIYAKIRYRNSNGKIVSIDAISLIDNYNGNYLYYSIPNDIDSNGQVELVFTFRNKQYIYQL